MALTFAVLKTLIFLAVIEVLVAQNCSENLTKIQNQIDLLLDARIQDQLEIEALKQSRKKDLKWIHDYLSEIGSLKQELYKNEEKVQVTFFYGIE